MSTPAKAGLRSLDMFRLDGIRHLVSERVSDLNHAPITNSNAHSRNCITDSAYFQLGDNRTFYKLLAGLDHSILKRRATSDHHYRPATTSTMESVERQHGSPMHSRRTQRVVVAPRVLRVQQR